MLGDTPGVLPIGYLQPQVQGLKSHLHPLDTLQIVLTLTKVLLFEPMSTVDNTHKSLPQQDLFGRMLLRDLQKASPVTEAQLHQFMLVISKNYWVLDFWTCQDQGHSSFTCSNPDWKRRLYFAYRFYLYHVDWHLQARSFLQGQPRDKNLSRSNNELVHNYTGLHHTEYWGYRNNGQLTATQCPPINIRFAGKSQNETIL